MNKKIPIEVSARHVHLSKKDLEVLFGTGYELKKKKQLTQASDFAAEETIDLKVGFVGIGRVRVVGPVRAQTQIELSITDAISLGINPPVKISGDLKGSLGVTLIGPAGKVELKEGMIISQRHIHCSAAEAKSFGIKDGDIVSVLIKGKRETTFHNVIVRVKKDYKMCLHLDTDEGNAAGIIKTGEGYLVK